MHRAFIPWATAFVAALPFIAGAAEPGLRIESRASQAAGDRFPQQPFVQGFSPSAGAEVVAPAVTFGLQPNPAQRSPEQWAKLRERDSLSERVDGLLAQGKLAEAMQALGRIIKVESDVLGEQSEDVADSYGWLADVQEAAEDFPAAVKSRQAALKMLTKLYPKGHYRAVDAGRSLATTLQIARLDAEKQDAIAKAYRLNWQVLEQYRNYQFAAAVPAALEALEITKKIFGDQHPLYADRLEILALLCQAVGDFARAEPLFQQALAIQKKALGEQHPDYAKCLNNLAVMYEQRGELARAEPLFEQAAAIYKQALGTEHPSYAKSLNNLADLYRRQGQYARALPLFEQALAIKQAALGEEHPDYATSLNNLAVLYDTLGDYARGEPLIQQAVAIRKNVLGEEHPEYASSLSNLAVLYGLTGDFARAEPLFKRVLAIRKQTLGRWHPDYAAALNNLAGLYKSMGMYSRALPFCLEALEIDRKALGENHPDYATRLETLADLYSAMGDRTRAEPLYRHALAILKQSLGEAHPDYAMCLIGLAGLYDSMGDFAQAGPLYLRALAIQKNALGEQHPEYAETLRMLANLYEEIGDFDRAEPLQRQALEINKKALGEEHFIYARNLNILADFYRFKRDYVRAEPLYLQALAIEKKALGDAHPDLVITLSDLAILYQATGDFGRAEELLKQALEITRKMLGEDHPDFAEGLDNLSQLYLQMGDYARGEPLARQACDIMQRNIENTLPALSDAQAIALFSKTPGPDLWLSIARELPEIDPLLAWSQAWRGRGLVAAAERQRRLTALAAPQAAPLLTELRSTQQQLAQLILAAPRPEQRESRDRRLAELNENKESLERRLAYASLDFRHGQRLDAAGPEQLLDRLPAGTVVVDLVKVLYYQRETAAGQPDKVRTEMHYEAFVVRRKSDSAKAAQAAGKNDPAVAWIHLGPTSPIEEAANAWREAVIQRDEPSAEEDAPEMILRRLVWAPLEAHFGGCQTVIVIPDGLLEVLPFSALPGKTPGSQLLDEYQITVASHGRQLIQLLDDRPDYEKNLVLVGGVDYDHRAADGPGSPAGGLRLNPPVDGLAGAPPLDQSRQTRWKFLPGSKTEVEHVAQLWQAPGETTPLSALGASESALRAAAPSARYLHLATHGFFANPVYRSTFALGSSSERLFSGLEEAKRGNVMARNPLVLTGVVLAGANLPPETDKLGLPVGEDGIFTAEEVVNLDLRGTQLVVLSACETGLGAIGGGGEGVFGLQRAFHLAGSRNVVGTLWRVNDAATMVLMTELYKGLWRRQLSPAAALRRAQLVMLLAYDPDAGALRSDIDFDNSDEAALARLRSEQLAELDHAVLPPYYWSAFSFSGDWR
ncbi:MAG TPA: tetratricopeptide repeat protein [Pirellulales bacterium]|nr:tetratricopeptide repeat protein [Pirellulales bacterium]